MAAQFITKEEENIEIFFGEFFWGGEEVVSLSPFLQKYFN